MSPATFFFACVMSALARVSVDADGPGGRLAERRPVDPWAASLSAILAEIAAPCGGAKGNMRGKRGAYGGER